MTECTHSSAHHTYHIQRHLMRNVLFCLVCISHTSLMFSLSHPPHLLLSFCLPLCFSFLLPLHLPHFSPPIFLHFSLSLSLSPPHSFSLPSFSTYSLYPPSIFPSSPSPSHFSLSLSPSLGAR